MDNSYNIQLIGYCNLTTQLILEQFTNSGPTSLTNLEGEYIIILDKKNEIYVITSPNGICQYYYTQIGNCFYHGENLFTVLMNSNLTWEWNWKVLTDLSLLDHILEDKTLHPLIYKVPKAAILHFKDGKLNIIHKTWEQLYYKENSSASILLDTLNTLIKTTINKNSILSLSGGLDSRVILSSMLRSGFQPKAITMGYPDSSDVLVAKEIVREFKLDWEIISMDINDYLSYGEKIVQATSCEKTAWHWHTYLYTLKSKINFNNKLFIGSNGEFLRTYYLDKGILSKLLDKIPLKMFLNLFWKGKLKPIFTHDELYSLNPNFMEQFTVPENQEARIKQLVALSSPGLLDGLDKFYLEQRVRNFIGNGIKLYSLITNWYSPFLNQRFINLAWNLDRNWKLNSNWHLFAIKQNCPQLEKVIEKNYIHNGKPYANYKEWSKSSMISEFLIENSDIISDIITKKAIKLILDRNQLSSDRTRTIYFLLTLIYWKKLVTNQKKNDLRLQNI